MIYIFFGEFYHFNTTILGILEKYFYEYPNNIIDIITFYDYAIILKKQFGNNINLIIPQNENTLYMSYRRTFEGNPSSGDKDNFKLIKKYGNITPKSKLIETNSWFENCEYLVKWCLDHNYPGENKNMYGNKIDNIKPKYGWSYYTYLKLKFPHMPWINCPSYNNDIYQLYNDLLLPFIKKKDTNYYNNKLYNIKKKIYIKYDGLNGDYINIFPRLRQGQWKKETHCSYIDPEFWKNLLLRINNDFPNLKCVVHGHQESCRDLLVNYKNMIFTESIEDSIKFLSDSKLLITPISGLGRLAMNCGIKNIIEVLQPKSTHTIENIKSVNYSIYGDSNLNPFNSKIYSIKFTKLNSIMSIIRKLNH